MKKLIKNVVELDMTKATPESVKGVTINNVVSVIVTTATKPLLGQMDIGNMVEMIEIPEGAEKVAINGNVVIDSNEMACSGKETFLMINGNLVVRNGVSTETLQKYISRGANVNGSVILPSTMASLLTQLNVSVNGNIMPYPADSLLFTDIEQFSIGSPIGQINNNFLEALPVNANITIVPECAPNGELLITHDTCAAVFEKHIGKLTVFGNVIIPESLTGAFYKAASQYGKVTVMPDGYVFQNNHLHINAANILGFKDKSIYTRSSIIFKDGLDSQRIQQMDFKLQTESFVILPEYLADVLLEKIKSDTIYTYKGQLVSVTSEINLSKTDLQETTSFFVRGDGEITFNEDISAEDIQNISEIFLYGNISLWQAQAKVINNKLAVNKGNVEVLTHEAKDDSPVANDNSDDAKYDVVIGNAVEYAL